MKLIKPQKNQLKEGFKKAIEIWFADGKTTLERIMALFSALFWTWLDFSFLVFFFTFAFGIAGYVIGGSYPYSWETIKNNRSFMDALIKAFVLIIFILRVPIRYEKKITSSKEKTK